MTPAPFEIDHLFVFVERGAPDARRLDRAGLRPSYRRRHIGQGTANICYCFDNAYLELLWVADEAEINTPAVARTRLAERADWRRTGASPFGIALRTASAEAPLPFETWDYAAPFLPQGMILPVARASDDPRQPFLFRSPGTARPDAWTGDRANERQVQAGLREIVAIRLGLPSSVPPSPALKTLEAAGLLSIATDSDAASAVLTLSGAESRPTRRLSLPGLDWLD